MFKRPFESIVVGIDFSPYSKLVVKQAIKLSLMWNAQVYLVHAFNEPTEYAPSLYITLRKPLNPTYYKNKILKYYNLKKFPVKLIVDYDMPTQLIRKTARSLKKPLIMAGYKGNAKVAEVIFGSTAHNLALGTKSPVWIHRGNKVIEPNRILIPHDLSKQSNRSIDLLKKLELMHPVRYQVCFVREKPLPVLDYELYKKMELKQVREVQKETKSLLAQYPGLSFLSTTGEVADKVVRKTRHFDLILIAHRHSAGFFSISETRRLISKSHVPLLIV